MPDIEKFISKKVQSSREFINNRLITKIAFSGEAAKAFYSFIRSFSLHELLSACKIFAYLPNDAVNNKNQNFQ